MDAIDHSIIPSTLHHTFDISDSAFSSFQSRLSDRTQVVSINGVSSAPAALNFGLPQGSVLGPSLFVLSDNPIYGIVSFHSLPHHSFSDDNQVYKSGNLSDLPEIIHSTQSCTYDVKVWTGRIS